MIKVDECDPLGELEPSFPYRDVQIRRGEDIKEFYEMQTEIGRGKFGTVYRCREKATGLQLAAKFVATPRRDDRRNVEREVDIMRRLQHPRLIQLYDAFDSNGKAVWLLLEIIEGGELFERVIDDDFVLTEKACTIFMRQICEGVEFIHRQCILHLDMKPENILCLTKTGNRIKIIDFGLARKFDPQKKLQVLFGTPEFVAPEVVNFDQIGYGTDMWSVGVICYVLLSGLSPFMGETDIETMANVTIAKYDFEDEAFNEISEDAKDFIKQLLVKDKEVRMSSSQCLAHPWLKRTPPAPPPPIIPAPEELDVTKDNLRSFVERWSEHPDSPYVFDTTCHSICPLPLPSLFLSPSQHSLHGMSPSPCGSLSSSQESIVEADPHIPPPIQTPDESYYHYAIDKKGIQLPPSYVNRLLHERRASDSSCVVMNKHAGGGELSRVNLVDEIRKLSDRLFQMASQQHIPTNTTKESDKKENFNDKITPKPTEPAPELVPAKLVQAELQRRNSDVPWRRSTFMAGPLTNGTTSPNKRPEEDLVRRPKFKITPFARDVPLAPPPTKVLELKSQANNNFNRNTKTAAATASTAINFANVVTSTMTTSKSTISTTHSMRWGIPLSNPTYSCTFSRSSTSTTASSSSSTSPIETTAPLRCPSSSSSVSYSAPHSPVQTQRQIPHEIKADLTDDFISHLLDKNRWDNRTDIMTNVVCSEESSRKALSMEWSQVEMTMDSLGQRTMKSLAKILESSTKDPSNGKDSLGSKERQTLARNLSQLGV